MKTDKRQILISHCKEKGELKTSEANDLLKRFYYHNHAHYVAEILSRLVKSGVFARVKNGLYTLIKEPLQSTDKNQTKLF